MQSEIKTKIGIYGGTFSPIHIGHIASALSFKKQFGLDKLIIMPASVPPHKTLKDGVSTEHRYNMCLKAFENVSEVEVSRLEIDRVGKSYTFDTVSAIRDLYPDSELYLLCGTDMILTFDDWYRYDELLRMINLVYARRESDESIGKELEKKIAKYRSEFDASIQLLSLDASVLCVYPEFEERVKTLGNKVNDNISSTLVRTLLAEGKSVGALLPCRVVEYINANGLYV